MSLSNTQNYSNTHKFNKQTTLEPIEHGKVKVNNGVENEVELAIGHSSWLECTSVA